MQIVFNHNSKTFFLSKCFFNHNSVTIYLFLSIIFIIIKIIFQNIRSIVAKWSDNVRYLIFAHMAVNCFVIEQRLQLYLNFLFPVCFQANLGIQKALFCQSFRGQSSWTPLGALTAHPQTPQLLWSPATQVKTHKLSEKTKGTRVE